MADKTKRKPSQMQSFMQSYFKRQKTTELPGTSQDCREDKNENGSKIEHFEDNSSASQSNNDENNEKTSDKVC